MSEHHPKAKKSCRTGWNMQGSLNCFLQKEFKVKLFLNFSILWLQLSEYTQGGWWGHLGVRKHTFFASTWKFECISPIEPIKIKFLKLYTVWVRPTVGHTAWHTVDEILAISVFKLCHGFRKRPKFTHWFRKGNIQTLSRLLNAQARTKS